MLAAILDQCTSVHYVCPHVLMKLSRVMLCLRNIHHWTLARSCPLCGLSLRLLASERASFSLLKEQIKQRESSSGFRWTGWTDVELLGLYRVVTYWIVFDGDVSFSMSQSAMQQQILEEESSQVALCLYSSLIELTFSLWREATGFKAALVNILYQQRIKLLRLKRVTCGM